MLRTHDSTRQDDVADELTDEQDIAALRALLREEKHRFSKLCVAGVQILGVGLRGGRLHGGRVCVFVVFQRDGLCSLSLTPCFQPLMSSVTIA